MVRLKDVGKIITGNTPKTSEKENYESNDICFVKPSDIESDGISYIEETENFIAECAREKARILPVNSVLVTCIGIIGKIGINKVECAFNQQINAIVPNEEICLAQYLAYAIKSKKFLLQDIANAPVVPILNKTQFADVEIKIVDLKEQESIVHKLAKVEALLEQRKQQLQKLDELVKARFVEMFGDINQNDRCWKQVILGDICEIKSSKRVFEKDYVSDGVPFFRTKEIVELSKGNKITTELFISNSHFENIKSLYGMPQKNDLLITAVGTIGTIWIVDGECDFYFKDGNIIQVKASDNFNSIFMKFLLTEVIRLYKNEMSTGTAYSALTIAGLKNMVVYDVPLPLQNQFADFVQQIDKSKLSVQKSLEKLEVLKKTLMQKYFG